MPQLDTSTFTSQLFWLIVCFLLLYLILSYVAVPKITHLLSIRAEEIEEKINKAGMYREQAADILNEYEAALAQAKIDSQVHYKSLTKAISSEIAQKQKDFLDKLNDRLHRAEQDIYKKRQKEHREIKTLANDVAAVILNKLTGRAHVQESFHTKGEKI